MGDINVSMNDNPDFIYKQELLNSGVFRPASRGRYTCQCPFCNDNKRHMYVHIKLDGETPLLYYCFKCNSKGVVNKEFLDYLGLTDIRIPRSNKKFRRKIDFNKVNVNVETCNENDNIDYVCKYIERKVGEYPSFSDLQFFQYISNPYKYAHEYLGYNGNDYKFRNRHWFRTSNGGLIGRHNEDNTKINWLKIMNDNKSGVYTIKLPFDLYKPINVCICEGVMDAIGLYYHYKKENNIYIATLGKDYKNGLSYLVNMGIFGTSVNIKIFKDSDVKTRDINIDNNLKMLFGDMSIYQNVNGKDYGLPIDKLDIQKCVY